MNGISRRRDRVYLVFLGLWTILNLISAGSLELYFDEAYYWMYSKYLSWGYFDHPPAIAQLIALGNVFGKTELSVRLGAVLMSTGSMWILYVLIKPIHVYSFILVIFSFFILHLIGFMAVPDVPFFFFALCFIYCYKRYLHKPGWLNALLIALFAALMLYSKYHGGLVILFVLLSNPGLFKDIKMYVAGGLVVLLFLPHLYWQYTNHFPSFHFHLVDRAESSYKIQQSLEYIFAGLPFLGGLVGVMLFIFTFRAKAENLWERALKFNLYGTLLFFFFYTFKGQSIEPNWIIFCVLPILYFGLKGVEGTHYQAWLKGISVFSFLLVIVFRIHLQYPFGSWAWDRAGEFRNGKSFATQVDSLAGDAIIVAHRYQEASLLNFYLDKPYPIFASNIGARHNQYTIWKFDTMLNASRVAYVNKEPGGIKVEGRYTSKFYIHFLDNTSSLKSLYLDSVKLVKSGNKPMLECFYGGDSKYGIDSSDLCLTFKIKKVGKYTYFNLPILGNTSPRYLSITDSLYSTFQKSTVTYVQVESTKWRGTNHPFRIMSK